MNKLLVYRFATWALVLLNIAMIAFFILTKPQPHQRPSGSPEGENFLGRAIEIMHLDQDQERAFKESAMNHRQKMDSIGKQQQMLLKPYFKSISKPDEQIATDSILGKIQFLEGDKIRATHAHFDEVKSLLRDDQQVDFKVFMDLAIEIILPNKENRPPPPKDLH